MINLVALPINNKLFKKQKVKGKIQKIGENLKK